MSHLISARHLTRTVGTKRLFSGINFTVGEGDKVGLVGHNGSGKTSLLRLLNGSEHPEAGEIVRRRGLRMETVEQFLPASLASINMHSAVLERLPEKDRAERAYQANIAERFLTIEDGVLEEISDPGAFYARLKDSPVGSNDDNTRRAARK